jgi:predicted permease
MSSVIRKPSFAFPLGVIIFIVHPFVVFCLAQMDREKGSSATRDMLEYALFFPSTVFDFFVRAITHKSPVVVLGAFWGDIVFGFVLNAVGWALVVSILWMIFDRLLEKLLDRFFPQTSNQSLEPTAGRRDAHL